MRMWTSIWSRIMKIPHELKDFRMAYAEHPAATEFLVVHCARICAKNYRHYVESDYDKGWSYAVDACVTRILEEFDGTDSIFRKQKDTQDSAREGTPRTEAVSHANDCGAYDAGRGHNCDCDITSRIRDHARQLESELATANAALEAERAAREEAERDGWWFSWIPRDKKLPKIGSWVLGCASDKETVRCVYYFAAQDFRVLSPSHNGGWKTVDVAWWMPMPSFGGKKV